MANTVAQPKYTTASIPIALHMRIEKLIKEKGDFKSVSDYVTFVLREIVLIHAAENIPEPFTSDDIEALRARFEALGSF